MAEFRIESTWVGNARFGHFKAVARSGSVQVTCELPWSMVDRESLSAEEVERFGVLTLDWATYR